VSTPGATPGVTVAQVIIVGYEDHAEAANQKYVSGLCRIEKEYYDCDLTRKIYVDEAEADAKAYSTAALTAYVADADKTVVCARLRIGEEYDLTGSGLIWEVKNDGCSINGSGELIATAEGLAFSRNGHQLLSFRDNASSVYITNYNFTTWTFDIATNGVEATPFLEWCLSSLIVQDWTVLPDAPTLTNGVYRFVVADPPTTTFGFVRAMQPVGTSAVVIDAQVLTLKDSTGGVWQVSISTNGTLTTTKE